MWFFDRDHPNFFVRLLAKALRGLVWLLGLVALTAVALWALKTFAGIDVVGTVQDAVDKVADVDLGKTAGGIVAALFLLWLLLEDNPPSKKPTDQQKDRQP